MSLDDAGPAFGESLRRLRVGTGLSQEELAGRSGLAARTIARLEKGLSRCPHPESARRLADALKLGDAERAAFMVGAGGRQAGTYASADGAPQAAAAAVVPRQLPAAPGHFTGRDAELGQLAAIARGVGAHPGTVVISAIDGMAGVGKTALAVHVAHRVAQSFPDGQLFVDLHGYTQGMAPRDPGDVLAAVLQLYGVPPRRMPSDLEARAALYRHHLAATRTLIVLDNAADEAQVLPLLPGSGDCLVLITSRKRLRALDDAHAMSLDVLPPAQAVALFQRSAGPERTKDARLAGEIAALCGHLPLALRIAAALLRHRSSWTMQYLAQRLRALQPDLTWFCDGQRDLAAVFDLSLNALSDDERSLLRLLGAAPSAQADSYAAAALMETDPVRAERLLENLVDHSLLIESAPGRYRMQDLIRDHALAQTAGTGTGGSGCEPDAETTPALARLLRYYEHTAAHASVLVARQPRTEPTGPAPAHAPSLPDAAGAWGWLRAERANLDAAFDHAAAHGQDEHVVRLSAGLAYLLLFDGPWPRATAVHSAGAAAARRLGDRDGQAEALVDLGMIQVLNGDYSGAGYIRALEIYRDLGHRLGQAHALHGLAGVRLQTGDLPAAAHALSQALETYRVLGLRHMQAFALIDLGRVRQQTGDLPAATAAFTQALEVNHDPGDPLAQAIALTNLGTARRLTGDLPGAAGALTRAMEYYRRSGNRASEAWALNHYAAMIAATGDLTRALDLYRSALAYNRELDKPDDEAISLEGIAECTLTTGDTEGDTDHLKQALEIYQRLGMRLDTDRVRSRLAELHPHSEPGAPYS
jgi:tetratricopeptide (TPR) repeat protein/transcriptional regulator with XRE-family HTH domain